MLTTQGDAFALGVMIGDILSEFTYWNQIKDDPYFTDQTISFPSPANIESGISSNLKELLVKNPANRMSLSTFAKSSLFQTMTTKKIAEIEPQKMTETLEQFGNSLKIVSSDVKVISGKMHKMNLNLNSLIASHSRKLNQTTRSHWDTKQVCNNTCELFCFS